MLPPNKTRDLARSLVASEADASTTSLHPEPATVRVYERLRRQLGSPVGVDGFSGARFPCLGTGQVAIIAAQRGAGYSEWRLARSRRS